MNQSDIDARILQQSQQIDMVNSTEWKHDELRRSGGRATRSNPRARLGNALIAIGSRLSADATA